MQYFQSNYPRNKFCMLLIWIQIACLTIITWQYQQIRSSQNVETKWISQSLNFGNLFNDNSTKWISFDFLSQSSLNRSYVKNDTSPTDIHLQTQINTNRGQITTLPPALVDDFVDKPLPSDFMLILVISAIDQTRQRNAIRNSWGAETHLQKFNAKLRFVVGTTSNRSTNVLIARERLQYQDIVQVTVLDTYKN